MSANAKHLSVVNRPAPVPVQQFTVSRLMKAEVVAAWLDVEVETLYTWVQRRLIPFHRLGPAQLSDGRKREKDGRPLRFDYFEIQEWTRTGALPEWFVKATE